MKYVQLRCRGGRPPRLDDRGNFYSFDSTASLDKIVEDCVSFVGVDLNTASTALLTRIAGLTGARAKKIVEWRDGNGAFVNRDQLKLVSGLGPKSFEQVS